MEEDVIDYYAVLGVVPGCSAAEVRRVYRALAKAHHPDVREETAEAAARIRLVNEAYRVLGDPARRRAYDAERGQPPSRSLRRTPVPVVQEVLLSFCELVEGASLAITVNDPANVNGSETYRLAVPAMTAPGTRFRIERRDHAGGGVVQVRIKARPDRLFRAKGSDVKTTMRISTRTAEAGGIERMRSPFGGMVEVRIPARTANRAVIRVEGEGLPRPRGGRGDLLVMVTYRVMVQVSRVERERRSFPRGRLSG
jgi:curved DNA-binding protein